MKNKGAGNHQDFSKFIMNNGEHLAEGWITEGKVLPMQSGILENYEKIRERLIVCPYNYDSSSEVLKDKIYNRIGDIALVLCFNAGAEAAQHVSCMIPARLLSSWKQKRKDVMEAALKNTYDFSRPVMWCIHDLSGAGLKEGYDFMNQETLPAEADSILGTIVSNADNFNGAVSVFLPGVVEKLRRCWIATFISHLQAGMKRLSTKPGNRGGGDPWSVEEYS